MTAIDSKSSLDYLNELVNEYNDTYHCSISKKPIDDLMMIILPSLKTSNQVKKLLNLEFLIESGLLSKRIFSARFTVKIGQDKYLLSSLC